jgi:hypothetical protein
MQLAYYFPYGTNYLQYALLGVILAFLATAGRRTATLHGGASTAHGYLQGGKAA